MKRFMFVVGMLSLGSLAACSGSSATKGDAGVLGTDWLPLAVGSHWRYQVTAADGTVSSTVDTVAAQVLTGGDGPNKDQMAFKLVSGNSINDPNGDLSYQAVVGGRVVKFRELSIDGKTGNLKHEYSWNPPRLRLDKTDEHTKLAAYWVEMYEENEHDWDTNADAGVVFTPDGGISTKTISDSWTVKSVSETVSAPAGEFRNTLMIQRIGNLGASVKTLWYARGVGLVKEVESGAATKELSSYLIAP